MGNSGNIFLVVFTLISMFSVSAINIQDNEYKNTVPELCGTLG
jgi:hypothetical protein